ncbi:FAD-binding domain-containing protein [Aspergillus sergii]|uniref:FAD-binding domain-containing protein n=1 Tax=Aspergillus sergii TaxID=1034303 RepID=A0A5N6WUN2_9EURO|nr:FAD-binding domain-containing protein [Aspergillus sergii]
MQRPMVLLLHLSVLLSLVYATKAISRPRLYTPLASINQTTWAALNESVSGRLGNALPMMAPCYRNVNGDTQVPDLQRCSVTMGKRFDPGFVSDQIGGYLNENWGACQATGETCSVPGLVGLDLITPIIERCDQGSVPSMYVEMASVEDVQATFRFARENNIRLVIKNTGHDFKGRSSAPDSLALWTHNYRPPIRLQKMFTPDLCDGPVGDVITFGAGQQFQGIYEFAHENGYRVVGGSSATVGAAGGWITGGGHSILSNELGLGVDNVQQLKVVLPNGTYITTNRCHNTDLFFALRGGGGGTFGVITEMSVLAHPDKPMELVEMGLGSLSLTSASDLISILVANAEKWASEGWGGYIIPGLAGNGISSLIMVTSMLDHSTAVSSMQPVRDFVNQLGTVGIAKVTTIPSYSDVLNTVLPVADGFFSSFRGGHAVSSRIVPRSAFLDRENQTQLASLLAGILSAGQELNPASLSPLMICVTAPSTYSQSLPETDRPGGPGAASVTPAWRDGLWHVLHLQEFGVLGRDPTVFQTRWQQVHETMNPLRRFTPGSGAYQNEADLFEPDPVGSFWGRENYNRLLSIKQMVDPDDLLTVHHGVGSDKLDGRYICYPELDS